MSAFTDHHKQADELIASTKTNCVFAAVYWSDDAKNAAERIQFSNMLKEWAAGLEVGEI